MLINGVVVDYRSGQPVTNYPPRIKSLAAGTDLAMINEPVKLYCTCSDKDGDLLTYYWLADSGSFSGSGNSVDWLTPSTRGQYLIKCTVIDNQGGEAADSVVINVTDNRNPSIIELKANPAEIDSLEITELSCTAEDPDGDSLQYHWTVMGGVLNDSLQKYVIWTAPRQFGLYWLVCKVTDNRGGEVTDSLGVSVGHLVAYYTLDNNTEDFSGFDHNGLASGVTAVEDRQGIPDKALYFDGLNDYIRIANSPALNNQKAITISLWINISPYDSTQEAYPISHGNWENRWKISITAKKIRWTIKTDTTINSGVKDLDSQSQLKWDTWYMVSATYGDGKIEIYINGVLNSASTWNGLLLTTPIDLVLGQHLPGSNGYNFKGALDDVRIFNQILSAADILEIYNQSTGGFESVTDAGPVTFQLYQNYPNPFNPVTSIMFSLPTAGQVQLIIYDQLGRIVSRLLNEKRNAGLHRLIWHGGTCASGIYYLRLTAAGHSETKKMVLLR